MCVLVCLDMLCEFVLVETYVEGLYHGNEYIYVGNVWVGLLKVPARPSRRTKSLPRHFLGSVYLR